MNSHDRRPTFLIKTLGCKVNQYESRTMRESLLKNGFLEKNENEICDFYIINSCTVTHKADRDGRNLIRHFHAINPKGQIAVAGCYAELESDRTALMGIPGVAYLIRNTEKENIAEILLEEENRYRPLTSTYVDVKGQHVAFGNMYGYGPIRSFKGRNRAFVKVQDGCDHRCSYCKVSLVRGPSKSRSLEDIQKEVATLIEKGYKEFVLTGICLGSWHNHYRPRRSTYAVDLRGQQGSLGLPDLVKMISDMYGKFRVRLSSIEPIYVTDELIDMLGSGEKVCKHLHIPLQSGDDKILKLMKRPYARKGFECLVKKIRKRIPDIALTTDILAGFPGEKNINFLNTLRFVEKIKPSRIHVFSYSPRAGTEAAGYPNSVDKNEIRERVNALIAIGRKLTMDYASCFMDKTQGVLIEDDFDPATGLLAGYTDRYIRVLVEGEGSVKNTLADVRITDVDYGKNRVFGCLDNSNII